MSRAGSSAERLALGPPFSARSACAAVRAYARTAQLVGRANSIRVTSCTVACGGRRFAVYVPEELVPEVRRCLDNGRALQELLYEAAARYVKALKRARQTTAQQSAD